ncbi:hypothetical protein [Microlunatus soli]|uniref:ParB-like nuclease domain-containing protein n=1 Tax=Microlunatus soli TaxID=630515 RepID=A0A1H1YH90_9ACTN|nr:hypothetical protein [Microlunatus soli]SDT20898.1 hypothetical protein SAMN04489812_4585 [Microlunatus soli]
MSRAPFPLLDQLPAQLHGIILDFHWDADRLHALALPTSVVPIADLDWHLALPFWAVDGEPFRVSPAEVATDPVTHRQQWERTQAADLGFALDGYRRSDGRLVILDGIHRLLKASVTGRSSISVRVLPDHLFDAIAVTDGLG